MVLAGARLEQTTRGSPVMVHAQRGRDAKMGRQGAHAACPVLKEGPAGASHPPNLGARIQRWGEVGCAHRMEARGFHQGAEVGCGHRSAVRRFDQGSRLGAPAEERHEDLTRGPRLDARNELWCE